MDLSAVFYVPLLLRANAPGWIPGGLSFFRSGLENEGADPAILEPEAAFAASLPLSPGEARAALAEMLALGWDRALAGALRQQAAREHLERSCHGEQAREELAVLEVFSRTGKIIPPARSAPDIRPALVECQKILILARELERDRAEIARLAGRSFREEQALRAILGEGEEEASSVPDRLSPYGDPPPWRAILEAALPFLPEGSLLFTADAHMARDLRDAGLLRPLSQDLAARCADWPEELLSGLLVAEVPAWRLLGRRSLPPDRPWLARTLEALAARPEGGWPGASVPGRQGAEV
jgi:hypothetical protein